MGGKSRLGPKCIDGKKFGLHSSAQLQKKQGHGEKGVPGRAGSARRGPIDGGEARLRGEEKSDDGPDPSWNRKEGTENARKLSNDIVAVYHESRRGGGDMELLLEQFILTL